MLAWTRSQKTLKRLKFPFIKTMVYTCYIMIRAFQKTPP